MKRISLFLVAVCLSVLLGGCINASPSGHTIAPTTEATVPTIETTAPTSLHTEPSAEVFRAYLVTICRADFPIHSAPGYDYPEVGTVKVATKYTIAEEFRDDEGNLWGKLKSGAGWVDLTLNEKESAQMPPVTVSVADHATVESGNFHYCCADSSQYAYNILLTAHEPLQNVSFFAIDAVEDFKRGQPLLTLPLWDADTPILASVSFPGSASMYGLEFTDLNGVTHVYSIWESGRNGSVGISPMNELAK